MYQHLLTIDDLTPNDFLQLLTWGQEFKYLFNHHKAFPPLLQNQVIANLFFEPSTRTQWSFHLAARHLQGEVLNFNIEHSSFSKGETLFDTLQTLKALGCQYAVIRHPENDPFCALFEMGKINLSLINAGTGTVSHPTQTLADLLTINENHSHLENLKIAIVGDILHSRVATSNLAAFKKLGIKDVRLIGPAFWLPQQSYDFNVYYDLNALEDVDIIMLLRVQKERVSSDQLPDLDHYHQQFGLTPKLLKKLKPGVMIMHPGPINRGVEIADEVVSSPQSFIDTQVTNGLMMRMALFKWLNQKNSRPLA